MSPLPDHAGPVWHCMYGLSATDALTQERLQARMAREFSGQHGTHPKLSYSLLLSGMVLFHRLMLLRKGNNQLKCVQHWSKKALMPALSPSFQHEPLFSCQKDSLSNKTAVCHANMIALPSSAHYVLHFSWSRQLQNPLPVVSTETDTSRLRWATNMNLNKHNHMKKKKKDEEKRHGTHNTDKPVLCTLGSTNLKHIAWQTLKIYKKKKKNEEKEKNLDQSRTSLLLGHEKLQWFLRLSWKKKKKYRKEAKPVMVDFWWVFSEI